VYLKNITQGHPHSGKITVLVATAMSLLPLSLLAIAWDNCRIWTYPLIVALLNLWTIREVYPVKNAVREISPSFGIICLILIMTNIFIYTPLLDGLTERYGPERRIVYYIPFLIVIVMVFAKNFRLKDNQT
jgi:hypothetical protein